MPVLSLVLPVFNECENLRPLLDEIRSALTNAGLSYEIVAVDDGSLDGSRVLLQDLRTVHPELKLIFFGQHVGQGAAFEAGFRHASGDYVVTLDADLQNDPADIPALLSRIREGYDVVAGWRKKRRDGFFLRTLPSRLANWLARLVVRTKIHDLGCSLRIYRREAVSDLRLYGEMHRFICPLLEMRGARITELPVHHRPRHAGQSKYGLDRTYKVFLDLIHLWFQKNYQTKPIYIFGGFGFGCSVVGSAICLYALFEKLAYGIYVHRNPLMLIGIAIGMVGLQFIGIGLLAEILVRTYFEAQGKTVYQIKQAIGFQPAESPLPTTIAR